MSRFDKLEKEVNKGIKVDEKSNQVIQGWSPNNVRRLVIGFDYAIVQYYKTGGKYNKSIEIVDFRGVAPKELVDLQSDPSKYRPILNVLVQGRICSSIEEVVFASQAYPEYMLTLDTNTSKLASGNTTLENRFPRLRHISIAKIDIRTIANLLTESKESTSLLLDKLTEKGVTTRFVVEQHQDDWWKGSALRPKHYLMDMNGLPEYFEKVKETFEAQQREDKLESLSAEKNESLLKKYLPTTIAVAKMSFSILEQANKVFEESPIISKAEWSSVLQHSNMYKGVSKELNKYEKLVNSCRRIDFDVIIKYMKQFSYSDDSITSIEKIRDLAFNEILKNEEEYKRESNKYTLAESLQTLQTLTGVIFSNLVNIVFLSFAKYLTRNTPEYVAFFYSQLRQKPQDLQFTRSIMEYCNKHLEEGWSKKAMDKIQATEVLVEQYTVRNKNKDVSQILEALASVK